MVDAPKNDDDRTEEGGGSALVHMADTVGALLSGTSIPAPLRRNAFKAFSQLCTAAIDIPVAYLEGAAAERRAETQARVKLISTGADQIAAQMNVDPAFARAAVKKFGERIVREQVNLESVSEIAAGELAKVTSATEPDEATTEPPPPLDDDWLNSFEKEASQKSTEEMQQLFGRILAGEIRRPSTFSLKTVRMLGQLDVETAKIFRKLCSLSMSMTFAGRVFDARVAVFSGNAASNALADFGLSFDRLNVLHEYGLIIPDYNSYMDYRPTVAVDGKVAATIRYQNAEWGLAPTDKYTAGQGERVHGVALSRSGAELLAIVDPEPDEKYTQGLQEYWTARNLTMTRIGA
jgi:hypothetical protein